MLILTTTLSLLAGGIFYIVDGPKIITNTIIPKYRGFKRLSNVLEGRYTGFFTMLWITICMILKASYISLLQYINSTIRQIDRKTYEITYVVKGKTFKMIVKPKRGPSDVLLIYNEEDEDVGEVVMPYLGPEDNFHGHDYTPKFFRYKTLTFEMCNGNKLTFLENETINLKMIIN